jgi:hypothetical protein
VVNLRPTAFVSYDWSYGTTPLQPGGCGYYRMQLPMKYLQQAGLHASIGMPVFTEEHGFGVLKGADQGEFGWQVVVLKLLMHRQHPEMVRKAQKLGQVIVVDVDDAHNRLEQDNMAYKTTDPALNPDFNRDYYDEVIMAADYVTVSTEWLFDDIAKRRGNVLRIQNGIDTVRYGPRLDTAGDRPRLGWVGGLPWRVKDPALLKDWLPDYVKRTGLPIHHSGHIGDHFHTTFKDVVGLDEVSTLPLLPVMQYPSLLAPIDIGLIPLVDVDFNKAKSFLRGIEFAAAGIPFIASPSPEYLRLNARGIGRIARTPDEWVSHVDALRDPDLRRAEGEKMYQIVRQEHDMTQRVSQWRTLYQCLDQTHPLPTSSSSNSPTTTGAQSSAASESSKSTPASSARTKSARRSNSSSATSRPSSTRTSATAKSDTSTRRSGRNSASKS